MTRALLLVVTVACLAPGCKKHPKRVVPEYPTLQRHGSSFDVEGATVFHTKATTPDFRNEVAKFYDEKLLTVPGWKKTDNPIDRSYFYTDANMTSAPGGMWVPIDASKPGGVVEVLGGENQTTILVFESVPKAAQ